MLLPHVLQVCAAWQRAGQRVLQPVLVGALESERVGATAWPSAPMQQHRHSGATWGNTGEPVVPQQTLDRIACLMGERALSAHIIGLHSRATAGKSMMPFDSVSELQTELRGMPFELRHPGPELATIHRMRNQ